MKRYASLFALAATLSFLLVLATGAYGQERLRRCRPIIEFHNATDVKATLWINDRPPISFPPRFKIKFWMNSPGAYTFQWCTGSLFDKGSRCSNPVTVHLNPCDELGIRLLEFWEIEQYVLPD